MSELGGFTLIASFAIVADGFSLLGCERYVGDVTGTGLSVDDDDWWH